MDWHLMYDLLDFPKSLSTVKALWLAKQGERTSSNHGFHDEYHFNDNGTIAVEAYEANYGYYDEWIAAAERGARFRAYHSYGGEYGPGNAIGLNFKHYYTELTHDDSCMFVRVNAQGVPEEAALERVKEFIEAEQKYTNSIELLPDNWEEIIPLCHNKMPDG